MVNSTVPAALSALTARFTAAAPADLVIIDGPPYDPPTNFVCVGYHGSPDEAGVSVTVDIADMAVARDAETYDVNNVLSVWSGTSDTAAARNRAFAYLDVLTNAVHADLTLGVAGVARARVTDFDLTQAITGEGSATEIRFTVHIQAWRNQQ